MKVRALFMFQAIYYAATALWPFVHMKSFLFVSCPKTDLWLVKTVSVLLLGSSICFFDAAFPGKDRRTAEMLSICNATGLLLIDLYYVITDVICKVYLLDAALQLLVLLTWIFLRNKKAS